MPAFDWYQGTVRAPLDDVIGACLGLAEGAELKHCKGLQGYGHRTVVQAAGASIGQVWHGGTHVHPHVVFSSDAATAGADMIRAAFPDHLVTRLDVKEDFGEPDAFDRMLPTLLGAAHRHRVGVDTRGDHLLRKEGRTVYLGSKTSAVQCRQYDKAAELRAKFASNPSRLLEVPAHLTRLEVQVRPSTPMARQAFSKIEPIAAIGCSDWTRDIWRDITGMELERVSVTKAWRESDDDRAYSAMLAQYGRMLGRRMLHHGSWSAFGCQLGSDLADRAEAQEELHGRRVARDRRRT